MNCFQPFHRSLKDVLRTTRRCSFRNAPRRQRSWKSHVEALESRYLLAITSLSVENAQPFARVNEPVTSGVPLPQSLGLMNTSQLRILDSNNQPVPNQFRVEGRWNSGPNDATAPIRWLEVHFDANVPANATATYQLDVGGTGNASAALQANTSENFITVTTGPARFQIDRTNFDLFDTVWLDLDSNGTFADSERIVTPDAENGSYVLQGSTEFRSNREVPLSVVLEETGPLRSIVRAEGFHSAANGSDLLRYVTRLTFFAGQSFVQIDHEIVEGRIAGSGNEEIDQQLRTEINRAGLRINVELSGNVDVRSRGSQATVRTTTLNANSTAEVAQARLTNINNPLSYEVRQNGAAVETGQQASRAWQDVSDSQWGLAVGTREFWQKNPERLLAEQDGTVEIQFPSEAYTVYQGMGLGEQAVLYFHGAGTTTEELQRVLEGFSKDHLLAAAPSQWMVDSKAFGDLPAAELEAPFDAFDDFLEDSYTQTVDYINAKHAYGLLNYLDMPIDMFDGATNPDGISWGNSYYDPATAWIDQFARTGELRWLDLAIPYIQHWYTTDAYDTDDPNSYQNGISGARGVFHRGAWTAEYHYLESLWPYYYLTGDRMALERGLDAATTYASAAQYSETFDYGTGVLGPSNRIFAQKFNTMTEAWLATGSEALRSQLETQVREYVDLHFRPEGFLIEGSEAPPDPYVATQGWMTTHLVHDAIYKYFLATDDDQVESFLVLSPQRILQYNRDTSVPFRFFNNIAVDVGAGGSFTTSGFIIPDRGPDNFLYSWEIMGLGTALARAGVISENNTLITQARGLFETVLPQIDAGVWDKDISKTSLRGFAGLALVANSSGVSNRVPTLNTIEEQEVEEENLLTFTAVGQDPDGDQLTYSLDAGFPAGASIGQTSGVFSWTPTADQGPNEYDITVRVTDNGVPSRSASRMFRVIVTGEGPPPPSETELEPIADNHLDGRSGNEQSQNGTDGALRIYRDGSLSGEFRPILKFNLPNPPANSTFTSATLTLFQLGHDEFGNAAYPVTIRALTRDWTETGSTWTYATTTTPWTNAGGDFLSGGVSGSVPVFDDANPNPQPVTFDVTSLVSAWLNGTQQNFGFLIDPETTTDTTKILGSKENSNAAVRPHLQLVFQDNAPPSAAEFSFSTATVGHAEGQSGTTAYTFTVTRSGDTTGSGSVDFSVTGSGTNVANVTDFGAIAGTLNFAANDTLKPLTINVLGDTTVESDEGFTVMLSNPNPGATIGTATANGMIRNDDASLSIAATNANKAEGNSGNTAFTFTVTRTGDTSGTASVDFAMTGSGTNPANTADFGGSLPLGSVNFADDETSQTITINVSGDTLGENDEGFMVTLSNPSDGATIDVSSATGVIVNDDPVFSIATASASKPEGNSGNIPFTFTITRLVSTSGTASVRYAVSGLGSDPANAADFGGTFPTGTANFAANQATATITINVRGDTAVEANETFVVTLSNAVNAGIANATALGTILNEDASLAIAAINANQNEGDGGNTPFTFTVTRAGDASRTASVKYAVKGSGTSAANAADFGGTAFPSGTLNFAINETVKTITLNVRGDTAVEPNEGFTVTLSSPVNALLATATATGSILNDDASVAIAATSANKAEGNSGNMPFTFTVTRTGDTRDSSTVNFVVSGATTNGANAADFGGAFPQDTITFNAAETTKTITLNVTGETTVEPNEGFTVTLSNPTNTIIGTSSSTGAIQNDDTSLSISTTSATSANKAEGNSGNTAFTFTITRAGDLRRTASVQFAVSGSGTNTADAVDFGGTLPSGTVNFAANQASATITINVRGDTTVEDSEDLLVTLSNATNATLTTATAIGTIKNDDAVLSISPNLSAAEGNSGNTPFTFMVTRTGDVSRTASVRFTVSGNGTTTANTANAADFGGTFPGGTLNFAINETTKSITLNVRGDTTVESNEGFKVTLSNATNAMLNPTATLATGTIQNDDGLTQLIQDNADKSSSRSYREIDELFNMSLQKLWGGLDASHQR